MLDILAFPKGGSRRAFATAAVALFEDYKTGLLEILMLKNFE